MWGRSGTAPTKAKLQAHRSTDLPLATGTTESTDGAPTIDIIEGLISIPGAELGAESTATIWYILPTQRAAGCELWQDDLAARLSVGAVI